jgi:hypothetical protein
MRRRTFLQAGSCAAAGSLLSACAGKKGPVVGPFGPGDSSLPPIFELTGGSKGLQLFFHGLCAFMQPKTGSAPLRVVMLNGYPDHPDHRHYASLVLPRDGVDFANSTARPSAVDSNHIVYSLNDVSIALKYDSVTTRGLKVNKSTLSTPCVLTDDRWANFGWVLDMSQFADFAGGTRRDWAKVRDVSSAQFEAEHGSLEQDFDGKEQKSKFDTVEWVVNRTDRVLKQAARFRVHEDGISFELTPRLGGGSTIVALHSRRGVVNGAIMNLPGSKKVTERPGNRLTDALAYYQMLDPSPLNTGRDGTLGVPIWSDNPDRCTLRHSIECACCPPGEV